MAARKQSLQRLPRYPHTIYIPSFISGQCETLSAWYYICTDWVTWKCRYGILIAAVKCLVFFSPLIYQIVHLNGWFHMLNCRSCCRQYTPGRLCPGGRSVHFTVEALFPDVWMTQSYQLPQPLQWWGHFVTGNIYCSKLVQGEVSFPSIVLQKWT